MKQFSIAFLAAISISSYGQTADAIYTNADGSRSKLQILVGTNSRNHPTICVKYWFFNSTQESEKPLEKSDTFMDSNYIEQAGTLRPIATGISSLLIDGPTTMLIDSRLLLGKFHLIADIGEGKSTGDPRWTTAYFFSFVPDDKTQVGFTRSGLIFSGSVSK